MVCERDRSHAFRGLQNRAIHQRDKGRPTLDVALVEEPRCPEKEAKLPYFRSDASLDE